MTLIINNWKKYFEKADNKRYNEMKWIALPTRMEGKHYKRLAKMENSTVIFAGWILILELASKMPERGVLRDSEGDLSFEDMALMTDYPAKTFEIAVSGLLSESIGWLSDVPRTDGGQSSGNSPSTEHNITEQYSPTSEAADDPPKPKPENKFPEDSIPFRASKFLFKKIQERNPNHKKPDFQKWALVVDKMIRIDKREASAIAKVIEWSQEDDFWKNNILSTEKLRKQYDKLLLQSGRAKPKTEHSKGNPELVNQMRTRKIRVAGKK